MTIQLWLLTNTAALHTAGIASARLDCLLLLEHVLQKPREWILAYMGDKIASSHLLVLNTKITQRQARTPLAYLTNQQEFYGRNFYVNENVLIPRPESEGIIDVLKKFAKHHTINTVIDIGTGSGILAITTKKELPDVHTIGTDISSDAIQVARRNASRHTVQVQWKLMDATKQLPHMPQTRPFVFVANLPYVPAGFITSPEIENEPALALFSGRDGLCHYRSLWQQIPTLKNKPLAIVVESLENQHEQMIQLAQNAGYVHHETDVLAQLFTLA